MAFVRAAAADDLWAGEVMSVRVCGKSVLLLRAGGAVRAYEDRCPHQGAPLSGGSFAEDRLKCSAHEWTFDPVTGRGLNPRAAALRAYPARVEEGFIWVDVDSAAAEPQPGSERDPAAGGSPPGVGPVLIAGREAEAVIAAILDGDAAVRVVSRGAYHRVTSPRRCAVVRAAIEAHLGRPFPLPESLEAIMPSFSGRFSVSDEGAEWRLGGD